MDKQSKKDSLEEIVDEQYEKLYQLDQATTLIKSKHHIKNELLRMHDEVLQVSYGIENTRKALEKMKEQNIYLRELLSFTEVLNKKIIHQEQNVPSELIQSFQNINKQTYVEPTVTSNTMLNPHSNQSLLKIPSSVYKINVEKQKTMKDCKRTLFNEPEGCPTIPLITIEEFNKVPKYIIGRQTLEVINSLISAINQTLIAKYAILSLGKTGAQKKGEINLYLQYKKQELDLQEESEYLYFFTAEDYYRQTKTKIDKTKLNLITALRHCKRLRECRIKNELRYVITRQ